MYYKNTTQTPNSLFDEHLKNLSKSELKLLLTIIRKTIGQVDLRDRSKRLDRAWISQRLFRICTSLSGRAVSSAIDSLIHKELIIVTDKKGNRLNHKFRRRGTPKLYFSSNLLLETNQEKRTNDLTYQTPVKKSNTIKLKDIKLLCDISSQGKTKLTDKERIEQILQKRNTNP